MSKYILNFSKEKLVLGLALIILTTLADGSTDRLVKINCETNIHVNCGNTPNAIFMDNDQSINPHLLVVFTQNDHVFFTVSNDKGRNYITPIAVNQTPEAIYSNGENRPKIAAGTKGEIYISWTHKTNGLYAGDIRFSRSLDKGKTFSKPVTINNDGLLTSHRFDSLYATKSGNVYVTWLDKRDQVALRKAGGEYDGAALYFAISGDAGKNFLNPKTLKNYRVADNSCECCRIAIESHGEGDVAVMWRHIFAKNTRDHAYAILKVDGSSMLGRATVDNWQVDACPHHGPDLALGHSAENEDQYHMVWFSNGNDHKGIYYGLHNLSENGESQVYSVDSSPGASHPQIATVAIKGQEQNKHEKIYIAWKSFDGKKTRIKLIQSNDSGISWRDKSSTISTEGDSDHPLLLTYNSDIYLAWHTEEEGYRVTNLK
ncbi:MAG: hypothetical protein ACJA0N_001542 [Pseudohongiellaceae bacterium]|jgi:hypothetical protein